MSLHDGLIIKSIGGFYYVEVVDSVVECRARGVFRKQNLKPLVGDRVKVEVENGKGTVVDIASRRNFLLRPPVANIDKLIIISSVCSPVPNLLVIDRMSALAVHKNIEPVVLFSKSDMADAGRYVDIYRKSGITSFAVSSVSGEGIDSLAEVFENSVCTLTGNSGVGKSSLINTLLPELKLETGEISEKLGRGRHTTRSVELYKLYGGYIADTPGFSSVDIENGEIIYKEDLPSCFPEFDEYTGNCKFVTDCSHIDDKNCAVKKAVDEGLIAAERYASYVKMYNEVKMIKDWEKKTENYD